MTIFRHEARGTLINGEVFDFGLHTEKAAGDFNDAHTAWAAAIADLWNGTASPADSIKQLYPAATTIAELVTTELDPLTLKNVHQARSAPALVGTGSGDALPPQMAICVSLRTALPTRAGRGRFFLPAPIVGALSVGRLASPHPTHIRDAAALMLTDLQASTFTPVIVHRGTGPFDPRFGTTDPITSVDVGDVLDVIRARRDKLIEVRVSVAV